MLFKRVCLNISFSLTFQWLKANFSSKNNMLKFLCLLVFNLCAKFLRADRKIEYSLNGDLNFVLKINPYLRVAFRSLKPHIFQAQI